LLDKVTQCLYSLVMFIQPKFHLQQRVTVNGVNIPFVTDIQRAEDLAHSFACVVTAGPSADSVDWGHPNHCVETFHDITVDMERSNRGYFAPQYEQIERLVWFGGASNDEILVHCHAGISRSTSTAIGIAIARGLSPKQAVNALSDAHPDGHPFCPNETVISHVEKMFDIRNKELLRQTQRVERW